MTGETSFERIIGAVMVVVFWTSFTALAAGLALWLAAPATDAGALALAGGLLGLLLTPMLRLILGIRRRLGPPRLADVRRDPDGAGNPDCADAERCRDVAVRHVKSQAPNPKSQPLPHPKSQGRNPKSEIPSPKSQTSPNCQIRRANRKWLMGGVGSWELVSGFGMWEWLRDLGARAWDLTCCPARSAASESENLVRLVGFGAGRNAAAFHRVRHFLEALVRRRAHLLEQLGDPLGLTDDRREIALQARIGIAALEQVAVADDRLQRAVDLGGEWTASRRPSSRSCGTCRPACAAAARRARRRGSRRSAAASRCPRLNAAAPATPGSACRRRGRWR